jgi:hypothetical protein
LLGIASEPRSCTTIIEVGPTPEESDDCQQLGEELDLLTGANTTVDFPMPTIVATPLGAFATVAKSDADRHEATALNNDPSHSVPGMVTTTRHDGAEKSRTVVQHAAAHAFSIYTRSPLFAPTPMVNIPGPTEEPPSEPVLDEQDAALPPPPVAIAGPQAGTDPAAAPPIVLANHTERLVAAFGWVARIRNLADGALAGGLYLLFLLPVVETVRRRRLLGVLHSTQAQVSDATRGL